MKVVGIDPGRSCTGIACVDLAEKSRPKLVTVEGIRKKPSDTLEDSLVRLLNGVYEFVMNHRPSRVAICMSVFVPPTGRRNSRGIDKGAQTFLMVCGAIRAGAKKALTEIHPDRHDRTILFHNSWRKHAGVVGGQNTKTAAVKRSRELFGDLEPLKDHNLAEATLIGLAGGLTCE